jgi:ribosomal protein S18 acetylase RimI-like enzyme
MDIRRAPAEKPAVRRYVEDLWLPYQRDLEAVVEGFALADDVDPAEEVAFRMDKMASEGHELLVAVDSPGEADPDRGVADAEGPLVGMVVTAVDEAPPVFDRPDRLVVCELYVDGPHRGTGLAERLVNGAVERAREEGCPEVALDVDVGNQRAMAFYEGLGFETARHRMRVDADELGRRTAVEADD